VLNAGQTINCSFTNRKRGHIIVRKVTTVSGTTQAFEFDPSWSTANFNLTNGQSKDSGALATGTYSVAEINIPTNWQLQSAVCDDASPVSLITLSPGEVVTCTFTNAPVPPETCTFTQGGWGNTAHGGNPGSIRDAFFNTVYPNGVLIGEQTGSGVLNNASPWTAAFTSAEAVQNFLPAGSTPRALTQDWIDPTDNKNVGGVFGGQVLSLQLAVDFSDAQVGPWAGKDILGDLKVDGVAIRDWLAEANLALSGVSTPHSISFLNSLITSINEAFDGCRESNFATF
jgi:hypothetical protein